MDDSLYDDFGNYIGEVSDDDSEASLDAEAPGVGGDFDQGFDVESSLGAPASTAGVAMRQPEKKHEIVLHEEKQYYPEAAEVYGTEVAVLLQEEDTQPITEPIIPPGRKSTRSRSRNPSFRRVEG